MSNIAIKAENLSKAYQLGEIGTGTISRDLERWYARIRGKEDPFLRIGETNDRTSKGSSDIVWSLKDINFEIEQGDAVGIIGRNGAGKSTLLKVLSRVTSPTSGRITGKGRIASLLEVGTGFHPELTGRENIYLNGAILGMRKKEITRKFDEIVDFAGVERYIDTPVKRYSSGMYVRLAFAVAAHLESEILIVDEVLAVGDAEFQKKCLGKMGEVSKGEGRTVLFVSHNMVSVNLLCQKGILLNHGNLQFIGDVNKAIERYTQIEQSMSSIYINKSTANYSIEEVRLLRTNDRVRLSFSDLIKFSIKLNITDSIQNVHLGVALIDKWKRKLFTSTIPINQKAIYLLSFPLNLLLSGTYTLDIATFIPNGANFNYIKDICPFEIEDFESESAIYGHADVGVINVECVWE
ncbi:ABC transporter ATP-binding protein [Pedobacter chitinilyticus]|uniref:ATP-binding cassette domain-containing protein n=1 Tax=Pedobacter chitinilyticus TaxID=2233776 RepID=A0A3S3PHS9_9SPHI|nr:ABC transporter ATP-binding protein [Pedobacter chitinilyticus]RWU08598.1 ATP-binding cassette domain-containing protein [Pedobacter chitinilyticus]